MLTDGVLLQNRYRVVRLLNRGGMGAVYEAIDERLGSTVALKESFFDDPRMKQQFEAEAKMLARLRHPALTKVIDHFSEDDRQFLVMEFIGGNDFGEELKKRNAGYPVTHVVLWLQQLLDALDYIHTLTPPIIHRDIKPQNLKLTSRSQIILLDFGLAKNSPLESGSTNSASIFGYTPHYAALEQIQGSGTDARSDLYSLAATAYHLMTGVRPPDALSRASSTLSGDPDPLVAADELTTSVPPAISAVLTRAMKLNRNERYSSAAEMHIALREAAAAAAVSPSARTHGGSTVVASGAPTVVTKANVAEPTLQSLPTASGSHRRVDQYPPRKKSRLPFVISAVVLLAILLAAVLFLRTREKPSVKAHAGVTAAVAPPRSSTSIDVPATPSPAVTTSGPATGLPSVVALPAGSSAATLAFIPNSEDAVGGDEQGNVLFIRPGGTSVVAKLGGGISAVVALADGKGVVIGVGYDPKIGSPVYLSSFDGRELGAPHMIVNAPFGPLTPVAVSPDGRLLALGLSSRVRLFDMASKSFTNVLEGHTNAVECLAFSPDGKALISGSLDGTVRLWNLSTAKSDVLDGRGNGVLALAYSDDGRFIASAGYDGVIYLWGGLYGSFLKKLTGNSNSVSMLAFDNGHLICVTNDGTVTTWDVETGAALSSFKATGLQTVSTAALRKDHTLAVAQGDGKIGFWKLAQ